jgi:predicted protein tyrosine phosphatase
MKIQNVSYADIVTGVHVNPGTNSMLIQIVDPGMEFPLPNHQFKSMHQFEFTDVECSDDVGWESRITKAQTRDIANLIRKAKHGDMNIVVHCVAGVCRSGAVVEVATMAGFDDIPGIFRLPNIYVKRMLMEEFGYYVTKSDFDNIFK